MLGSDSRDVQADAQARAKRGYCRSGEFQANWTLHLIILLPSIRNLLSCLPDSRGRSYRLAFVCDWRRFASGKLWTLQDGKMGSMVGAASFSATDCRSSVHTFDRAILSGSLAAAYRHCFRCFVVRPDVLCFSDLSFSP